MDSLSSNPTQMANSIPTDGSSKKLRKPYTITKSRESWSDEEHDKFLEALQLFDRDWKKIGDFVGSKTVIQIRSHAQKYFQKVQKDGAIGHVPPPRPKRKASHPYPQKASKSADSETLQGSVAHNSSWNYHEPEYSTWDDTFMLINSQYSGIIPSEEEFNLHGYEGASSMTLPDSDLSIQGMQGSLVQGIPDFAEVYSFIGSILDPETEGHVQKLMDMDPIDTSQLEQFVRFCL